MSWPDAATQSPQKEAQEQARNGMLLPNTTQQSTPSPCGCLQWADTSQRPGAGTVRAEQCGQSTAAVCSSSTAARDEATSTTAAAAAALGPLTATTAFQSSWCHTAQMSFADMLHIYEFSPGQHHHPKMKPLHSEGHTGSHELPPASHRTPMHEQIHGSGAGLGAPRALQDPKTSTRSWWDGDG